MRDSTLGSISGGFTVTLTNVGIDIDTTQGIFWFCTAYTIAVVTLIWAIGLVQGNHSVMDGYYGFGYMIPAWVAFIFSHAKSQAAALLLLMASLHGARLGTYLSRRWRIYRKTIGGDPRYLKFKANLSPGYWWKSFFAVMHAQTAVIVVVGLPSVIGISMTRSTPGAPIGVLSAVGMLVFGIGYYFETVADGQLQAFKADPANKGRYLQTGVWTHSRHPNYFGTTVVWWGIYLVALAGNPGVWWVVVGPIVNTIMLAGVTGSPMTDKIMGSRPEYRAIIARTRSFFPFPK
jgi:steroid 5-alpha reductase family enzyme